MYFKRTMLNKISVYAKCHKRIRPTVTTLV